MPDDAAFSYETLSKQEATERKQPRLSTLDPNFWVKLAEYLQGLEQNIRKESERNPTSRKIALLQDELRNATRKSETLWETREKKITLHALKNSRAEIPPAPENALKTEQALYHDLIAALRKHMPQVAAAGTSGPAPSLPPAVPANVPTAPAPRAPEPVRPAPPSPAASIPAKPAEDAVTVRALVDVPPFVGLDGKTYRLKKGDILTLPRKMVEMLAKRGQVAVMA